MHLNFQMPRVSSTSSEEKGGGSEPLHVSAEEKKEDDRKLSASLGPVSFSRVWFPTQSLNVTVQ